ncbi:hypothetical protein GCM10010435_57270 [Winogradskya consettensis]|uniref:Protein kinase domain-containing protein n=1 Tax=Winogradskya consettensis TaxID=113560 RepID=A0A919VIL0_9ACTN|nr:serine/threonine-protein kinase [Actinoplanes consettensis]GIM67165.1 hypothetical protein Aco04nite_05050 [Actinoplanes consettensis]
MEPLQPTDPTTIGRYRLTGRLGAGGMGSVYLGLSPGGRPAAVKVIHENFQNNAESLARFRREVETLRTVRSAYTAALIDSEVDQAPYWLATEYVPGPTLHASVLDNGPFSTDACYGMFAALAEGLTDIHQHGVCHRDLKPQNIILAATGPQLIDFGIARGTEQTGLTQVGYAVGTPGYTAPETLTTNTVGPAADVFALGVTIGFVATARPPFGTGTFTAISMRTMDGKIDLPGVDPGLAALIRACVAADPTQRPTPEAIIDACHRRAPVAPPAPRGAVAGRTSVMPAQGGGTGSRPGQPFPGRAAAPGQGVPSQGVPGQGAYGQGAYGQAGSGPASGQNAYGQPVSGQAYSGSASGQFRQGQPPSGQARPGQGQPGQGQPGQGFGQPGPNQPGQGQAGMGQAGMGQAGMGQAGRPMSGTARMPAQGGGRAAAPVSGQFGTGKASVPAPAPSGRFNTTTNYDPEPAYSSGGGSRGGSGGGYPGGIDDRSDSTSSGGRFGPKSVALLSGLGVLILVLVVVMLTKLGGGNDPDQNTAADLPAATSPTPRATKTTKKAAAPTKTKPTPEKTEDEDKDEDEPDEEEPDTNVSNGKNLSMNGSGLCAEMPKNAAPQAKVKVAHCNGSDAQNWTYTSSNGLQQGDLCMDAGQDSANANNRTRVAPCDESLPQQFKQDTDGTLYNPETGLCLTIGDDDQGSGMGMIDCNGSPTWTLPTPS